MNRFVSAGMCLAVVTMMNTHASADPTESRIRLPRGALRAQVIEFDVAENAFEFLTDEAPVFEDGHPAYGNPFITHGFMYPKGFLDGRDGIDDDGKPAFPEKVIGEWYCRGTFIGNGARTETGPFVHTIQTYSFYDRPGFEPGKDRGGTILISQGYELIDLKEVGVRALTGGTGRFRAAQGEAQQSLIGFDELGGFLLRFRLSVIKRPPVFRPPIKG